MRTIYEVRERPSRIYSWTALLTSQLIVELPWNILCSSVFFFCWYWTVGFAGDRAGFSYLLYAIVFPLYYTTVAQAIAAMSPNAVIASILFGTLYSFVVAFTGVLQPFRELGWWRWMYRVSPLTYVIEAFLGQAIGHQEVSCASDELVSLNPPSGLSCSAYMDPYISNFGGYLTNPNSSSDCQFCSTKTTDQFLLSNFNIEFGHHWRNIGIILGVVVFNVFAIFTLTYIFRIRTKSIFSSLKDRITGRKRRS